LRCEIDMGDTSASTVARFPVQFNPGACNTTRCSSRRVFVVLVASVVRRSSVARMTGEDGQFDARAR
jgi:hypothetical protein